MGFVHFCPGLIVRTSFIVANKASSFCDAIILKTTNKVKFNQTIITFTIAAEWRDFYRLISFNIQELKNKQPLKQVRLCCPSLNKSVSPHEQLKN